jgi:hypothetical protein
MGIMPFIRSINSNTFKNQGIFKNAMDSEFLYYKLKTDMGDIVVLQNNKYSSDYLKVVYIILFFIFVFAIVISIPLISFMGKKFTKPIFEKYLERILGELRLNYPIRTAQCILCGGGGKMLKQLFLKEIKGLIVVEDIFCNAKGFARVGESIWH